jgi:hypothetical protein
MVRPSSCGAKQACLLAVCLALLGLSAGRASAADRYFAMVFSSQAKPKLPRFTHVWATMVKVSNAELPPEHWVYKIDTISWVPASLVVRTFKLRPEVGANLTLKETLAFAQKHQEHVSVWGPFETPEFIYCEFMTQKARLESGRVLYQCIDSLHNPETVSDCIHSLTDMDRMNSRSAYPLSRFGDEAASEFVKVIKARGRFIAAGPSVEFAYQALGLQCYAISRRTTESSRRFSMGR